MLRKRWLVLLGGFFLMGSAAWADDVGYVDCSSHPDAAQVYAKARQTPDVVASVSCGERFTILVYGFIFSRVQTRDGKVGYVYSNLISVDHSGASAPQPVAARGTAATSPSVTMAAEKTSVPRTPATTTQPAPQSAQRDPVTFSQPQPALAQPAPAPVASTAPAPAPAPEPTSKAPESAAATVAPSPAPPAEAQPAPVLPTAAQVEAATSASATQPAPSVPEAAAPAPQPSPAPAAAQPQPEPAEPAAQPVRNANVRTTWEKPIPGARKTFLLELYGGYSLARFVSGGTSTNLNGGMGSAGWNMTSWLQVVGDSSYNFVTVGTTKNVLYGNHFGPRFFYRRPNRWGITPFGEALIGGSRLDTTVSGIGGYKTSTNCISYKAGGGVDFRASRHWEVRAFDFDYYRTAFGTSAHQNNYSVSAGVVLRLFATGAAE